MVEDRRIAAFFEADVHEHDNEKKQHHHAADIDKYLHAGNEFGAQQNKERRHRNQG